MKKITQVIVTSENLNLKDFPLPALAQKLSKLEIVPDIGHKVFVTNLPKDIAAEEANTAMFMVKDVIWNENGVSLELTDPIPVWDLITQTYYDLKREG